MPLRSQEYLDDLRMADNDPSAALDNFDLYANQPYAQEVLEKAARNAADKEPLAALRLYDRYANQPYAQDVLEKAARNAADKDPGVALENFDRYANQPYAQDVLEKAARNAADKDTGVALENFDRYANQPYAQEVLEKAARNAADKEPRDALWYFDRYANQPYAQEVLDKLARNAADKDPGVALEYFDRYANQPYAQEVLEKAARNAADKEPRDALWYFDRYAKQPYALEVLEKAARNAADKDPGVALDNFDRYANQLYALEVLEKAVRNAADKEPGVALDNFDRYANQPYAQAVLKKCLSQVTEWERQDFYLRVTQKINYLHESDDKTRFKIISSFEPDQLFEVIVKGRAEIFTSSFNGVFDRLVDSLGKNNMTMLDFMKNLASQKDLPMFFETVASYGRMEDVFKGLTSTERHDLIDKVFLTVTNGLADPKGTEGGLRYAVTLSDMMPSIPDTLKGRFESMLVDHFHRALTPEIKVAFGLVITSYLQAAENDIANPSLFRGTDFKKLYPIASMRVLAADMLWRDGQNTQFMLFHNEGGASGDGMRSYASFLEQYRERGKDWQVTGYIKDKTGNFEPAEIGREDFVVIRKTVEGRTINIIANRPGMNEDDSLSNMNSAKEYLEKKHLPVQSFIHRGHSYFVNKSLGYLTGDETFVAMGSCGGYQQLTPILNKSPNAQILTTKGKGTAVVNDPLLRAINESALKTGRVDWREIETVKSTLGDKHKAYMLPSHNQGVMFIKSYNEIMNRKSRPAPLSLLKDMHIGDGAVAMTGTVQKTEGTTMDMNSLSS